MRRHRSPKTSYYGQCRIHRGFFTNRQRQRVSLLHHPLKKCQMRGSGVGAYSESMKCLSSDAPLSAPRHKEPKGRVCGARPKAIMETVSMVRSAYVAPPLLLTLSRARDKSGSILVVFLLGSDPVMPSCRNHDVGKHTGTTPCSQRTLQAELSVHANWTTHCCTSVIPANLGGGHILLISK